MSDVISQEEAVRLCAEHRNRNTVRLVSQCWGCIRFSKEEPAKMCFYDPPENRGCRFVNELYDAPKAPRQR